MGNGQFKPGSPRPPDAGRKPGSLNRRSLLVKQFLEAKDINAIDKILECLQHMDAEKQAGIWIQLMPYIYPKLTAITVEKTPEEEELQGLTEEALLQRVVDSFLARIPNLEMREKVKTIVLKRSEYERKEETPVESKSGPAGDPYEA